MVMSLSIYPPLAIQTTSHNPCLSSSQNWISPMYLTISAEARVCMLTAISRHVAEFLLIYCHMAHRKPSALKYNDSTMLAIWPPKRRTARSSPNPSEIGIGSWHTSLALPTLWASAACTASLQASRLPRCNVPQTAVGLTQEQKEPNRGLLSKKNASSFPGSLLCTTDFRNSRPIK